MAAQKRTGKRDIGCGGVYAVSELVPQQAENCLGSVCVLQNIAES
jgi:hypothetical protein